uniref:Uncharacterized protein n=1 Tax=Avena sativa TaxID=4498 RepID=A0ACD5X8W3_AVESA
MASSKAASTLMILLSVAALLLTCYAAGNDEPSCRLEDIRFTTAATGRVVRGQPEHKVTVENLCSCPQQGVVVYCDADALAASAGPVDRTKIRVLDKKGGLCLVDSGLEMFKGKPVTFTYASRKTLEFTLYDATPRC